MLQKVENRKKKISSILHKRFLIIISRLKSYNHFRNDTNVIGDYIVTPTNILCIPTCFCFPDTYLYGSIHHSCLEPSHCDVTANETSLSFG